MLTFEQFYLTCLSHASYLIGSQGIAAVVDPQRDVDIYLEAAREHGLEIRHIIETHLHADFVSGHRELAERTGAAVYVGARVAARFTHVPVWDGDEVFFGRCALRFLETPGHTLESVCVLVTDLDRSRDPFAILTGDTLFIGDVGRPDLAGDHTPEELARMLYDSIQDKLLVLPDAVEIYPAHGAGSLCGRRMSAERKSTIGTQRATNYALSVSSREEFVRLVTADLPERPGYFSRDVELNREGAPPLTDLAPVPAVPPEEAHIRQQHGAVILDLRPTQDFAAAHPAGAIQVGLSGQFATWAGIILGQDAEILLFTEDEQAAEEARKRLARVGIERVSGVIEGGLAAWTRAGCPVAELGQMTVHEWVSLGLDMFQVVDVRRESEWEAGHVPTARHKPLDRLVASIDDLDRNQPVAVYCKSGYRSTIACSILQRAGFLAVVNVTGGYDAWSGRKACAAQGS